MSPVYGMTPIDLAEVWFWLRNQTPTEGRKGALSLFLFLFRTPLHLPICFSVSLSGKEVSRWIWMLFRLGIASFALEGLFPDLRGLPLDEVFGVES